MHRRMKPRELVGLAVHFTQGVGMSNNVLILGAGGQVARQVVSVLGLDPDVSQTLYLRSPAKLGPVPGNARVVQGDVLDDAALADVMAGQDIVYVNLAGAVDDQVAHIIVAMRAAGVDRVVFMNSLGIHDEVPGRFGRWIQDTLQDYLVPYRRALSLLQESGLKFTNIRAGWMNDDDEIDYAITEREQAFEGVTISRKSLGALVADIVRDPQPWEGRDIGVSKPGSVPPDPRLRD